MDVSKIDSKIALYQAEITKLQTQKQEYLNSIDISQLLAKYDYDGDGVISVIDINMIPHIILTDISEENDTLYNATNKTYNGKSLDIVKDGKISITDGVEFIDKIFDFLNNCIDAKIYEPYNNGEIISDQIFNLAMSMRQTDGNGKYTTWPTIQEVKTAAKQQYPNITWK